MSDITELIAIVAIFQVLTFFLNFAICIACVYIYGKVLRYDARSDD